MAPNTFTAPVRAAFTIDLTVDQGIAPVQSVTYDGVTKNAVPCTFNVGAGSKNLAIVFAPTDPLATVSILEADGPNTQVLTQRPGSMNSAILIIN